GSGAGLGWGGGKRGLVGWFASGLVAMTLGMPRALFAVLSVSVYHAGASGTGVMYSAVSLGATVAAITTGWLSHTRRLGLVVIWAVIAWAVSITFVGLASSLWIAAALLVVAGAPDSVHPSCRPTI